MMWILHSLILFLCFLIESISYSTKTFLLAKEKYVVWYDYHFTARHPPLKSKSVFFIEFISK